MTQIKAGDIVRAYDEEGVVLMETAGILSVSMTYADGTIESFQIPAGEVTLVETGNDRAARLHGEGRAAVNLEESERLRIEREAAAREAEAIVEDAEGDRA